MCILKTLPNLAPKKSARRFFVSELHKLEREKRAAQIALFTTYAKLIAK